MKNLNDLKEQIQEDMLAYFNISHERLTDDAGEIDLSDLCQIVVDRVNELKVNWFPLDDLEEDASLIWNEKPNVKKTS